jgi:hypothetical protein
MDSLERYNRTIAYERQPHVCIFTWFLQIYFWLQIAIPVIFVLWILTFFISKLLH